MKALILPLRWGRRMLDYGQQVIRDFSWHRRLSHPDMPSIGARVWEQARLLYHSGISGEDYYHHALYRSDLTFYEKTKFLGRFRFKRYYRTINPVKFDVLARDKVIFHMLATALNIPTPRLLAVTRNPREPEPTFSRPLETLDELRTFLREESSQNIFFKPADEWGGRGALSLGTKIAGQEAWRMLPGNGVVTLDEVIAHVCREGEMRRFLIESRLNPHEMLENIVPGVCSTVRLMTLVDSQGVNVVGATLRLGSGHGPTDNLCGGGVVAGIELESGRLCKVVSLAGDTPTYFSSHPFSGVEVSGKILPDWAELVRLAVESARKLAFLPCIGWDIAITDNGPIIVEINSRPDCAPVQVGNDEGVLTGAFRELLCENNGTMNSGLHIR